MTRPVPKPKGDAHDAAAIWYARMTSDVKTSADEVAFDEWLAAAPENGEAYAEACALAGRFDALADHSAIAALRAEAQLLEERRRRPISARFSFAGTVTALAVAAAAAYVFYLPMLEVEHGSWTTVRGQTETITLSDGSHVILGSDSELEIAFRKGERDLELTHGQAFFDVTHNASRPFVVTADGRTVTALGTAFDVRAYPNDTTVTLVRGRVAVARPGQAHADAVLAPGQQFRAALGATSVRDVDASAETSWRTGVLDFNGLTLAEAVEQFNHSASHSIILGDPRLAELRVSGVFRTDDPQAFAKALAPAYPVVAAQQTSGDVLLTYRQ